MYLRVQNINYNVEDCSGYKAIYDRHLNMDYSIDKEIQMLSQLFIIMIDFEQGFQC